MSCGARPPTIVRYLHKPRSALHPAAHRDLLRLASGDVPHRQLQIVQLLPHLRHNRMPGSTSHHCSSVCEGNLSLNRSLRLGHNGTHRVRGPTCDMHSLVCILPPSTGSRLLQPTSLPLTLSWPGSLSASSMGASVRTGSTFRSSSHLPHFVVTSALLNSLLAEIVYPQMISNHNTVSAHCDAPLSWLSL